MEMEEGKSEGRKSRGREHAKEENECKKQWAT
jgi:hypothetical protein